MFVWSIPTVLYIMQAMQAESTGTTAFAMTYCMRRSPFHMVGIAYTFSGAREGMHVMMCDTPISIHSNENIVFLARKSGSKC